MPNRSLEALEAQVGDTNRTIEGFDVEAGKVAEFARAIHDPAAVYLDQGAAKQAGYDHIPAPPTFHRVSYFPRYRPSGIDEEFGFDLGFDREYVLHGEQRYEYERPLVVGDSLWGETTLENVFQRAGASGGTMTFAILRTDLYDESDDLVLQAWNTRIETDGAPSETDDNAPSGALDPAATGDGAGVRTPAGTDTTLTPGTSRTIVETDPLERRDFVKYAGASGDFNPIHYDEPYATNAGHPSVFGQGMFSAGIATRLVREWIGLAALTSIRTRFTARVFPGESLTVRGVVADETPTPSGREVEIEFEVVTAADNKLVVEGDATANVDPDNDS